MHQSCANEVLRRWADEDPPAAAAWAAQLPGGTVSRELLAQVAIAWAGKDLAAASSWANALSEGGGKQGAIISLAYEPRARIRRGLWTSPARWLRHAIATIRWCMRSASGLQRCRGSGCLGEAST